MIKTKNLKGQQAVTANRLRDGAVVFLTADGDWSLDVIDVAIAPDKAEADRLLAIAGEAVRQRLVVGPYLFEISEVGGRVAPVAHRERIRAFGPTTLTPEIARHAFP
jgi:hypothetical protein